MSPLKITCLTVFVMCISCYMCYNRAYSISSNDPYNASEYEMICDATYENYLKSVECQEKHIPSLQIHNLAATVKQVRKEYNDTHR